MTIDSFHICEDFYRIVHGTQPPYDVMAIPTGHVHRCIERILLCLGLELPIPTKATADHYQTYILLCWLANILYGRRGYLWSREVGRDIKLADLTEPFLG